jgi:hypothetical protein
MFDDRTWALGTLTGTSSGALVTVALNYRIMIEPPW